MSTTKELAKTYNMKPVTASKMKEFLSAEQRIVVTQNMFGLTVVPKMATIKSAFSDSQPGMFLISRNPDNMFICVIHDRWDKIFFMNLVTNKVEYLVNVEHEKRQPFEVVSDNEDDDKVPSENTLEFVKYVADNEGLDYALRNYSDFKNVKDKKFHALRKAYIVAAEAMEEYLAS
jgi:spore coat protein CotH